MIKKSEVLWNRSLLKVGFDKYIEEHGRLPSALEVDQCNYLPSSRHIQRIFGGLVHARKKLGYKDSHFGAGEFRSVIAKEAGRYCQMIRFRSYRLIAGLK